MVINLLELFIETLNAKKWGLDQRRYIPATMAERQVESTDFLYDASPYISTINYALNFAIIFPVCARIASFSHIEITATKFLFQQLHLGKLKNVNITMLVFTILIEKMVFHTILRSPFACAGSFFPPLNLLRLIQVKSTNKKSMHKANYAKITSLSSKYMHENEKYSKLVLEKKTYMKPTEDYLLAEHCSVK